MKSRWVGGDADAIVDRYAKQGIAGDVALCVYATRLIGSDPRLVLHGGGNTSVKSFASDLVGEKVAVLCVKGSGGDMAAIEPSGLPAVRLDPLRKLRRRKSLSDEDMVRIQRANLIDPMASNPSVETLLHAFLPHKFVNHSHASAVLSLVDQPDGARICEEVYGSRLGIVPYIMPGFSLAIAAADVYDGKPQVEGLVLLKHGIFSFSDDAREAYERTITMVTLAEQRLARNHSHVFISAQLPEKVASLADVVPILRGAVSLKDERAEGAWRRLIVDFRSSPAILNYVNGADLMRYGRAGVVTPDHTIRTKNWPLIVPAPGAGGIAEFKRAVRDAAADFVENYKLYFMRHNARAGGIKKMLDPLPRVALVPGLGLFGLGRTKKDASIAADLVQSAILTITDAEVIGRFESISEADMFDMEYWSLEQAKLGQLIEKPLAGQIVAVTGAAGAIGAATARIFSDAGAEVAMLDIDETGVKSKAKAIGGSAVAIVCDVTSAESVRRSFEAVIKAFGGVDIVISNAGAAWQGRIGEVHEEVLRKSLELNFYGHQRVAQAAVHIMLAQGTGGCLLFNVSKQAINPGPEFGPYGLPKAATLFLMRQYALDYGADGIRANAVNADRIRSGLLTDEMIVTRAKARGLSEHDYMTGNLLGREVTAEDVAQTFLAQALALKTTGNVTTVDGGNIAAALR